MAIVSEKKGKWLVFYLEGRLDVQFSQDLEDQVMPNIEKGELNIIFNLGKAEYISSSAINIFVNAMNRIKRKFGEFCLSNVGEAVLRVLKIVELDEIFSIYNTEEEILK